LNEVHDRFRTPYRAISAAGIVTLVLIAIGVGIGTLAEVASFTYLVTYGLGDVAVVVLRRADPDDYVPAFEIPDPLYPAVPILGFVACLAILTQMSLVVQAIGSVIVVFGVVRYAFYARGRAHSESLVGEATSPTGPRGDDPESHYRVVVPVANPETERDLVRMAAASAAAHDDEDAEVVAVDVIGVPQPTSLAQNLEFEEERVERQQELLEAARDIADELDVGLRTRAIVGRDAGSAILDVVDDGAADHVLLGWQGTHGRREHVLGSTIDPVVSRAPCDATLVEVGPDGWRESGEVMVLVGEGPHAPVATRRAAEFVSAAGGELSLTLFNVQAPADGDGEPADSPERRGEELIEDVAARAGVEYNELRTAGGGHRGRRRGDPRGRRRVRDGLRRGDADGGGLAGAVRVAA
jgi:nucleotide-binding universal stress UspA family protein